jgi:hypothetical protein
MNRIRINYLPTLPVMTALSGTALAKTLATT